MEYIIQILILIILVCFFFHSMFIQTKYIYKHNMTKHTFKNNTYTVFTIDNILNDNECSLIINISKPRLIKSSVISTTQNSNVRTSYNTFLKKESHYYNKEVIKVLEKLDKLANKLSQKPIDNQEPLQVVKYNEKQEYKAHYDCCVPMETTLCMEDTKKYGLRHSTLLIYLNDVEKGGETEFPLINYKFIPKKGTGIFFYNLVPNESSFHKLSKHAGLPPKYGEKWVCNKWIRTKPYKY
jgi:prolyl 4-hydroxylase